MKAVQYRRFGGPEVLKLVELPDPHPGQIRVSVRGVAINRSIRRCSAAAQWTVSCRRPPAATRRRGRRVWRRRDRRGARRPRIRLCRREHRRRRAGAAGRLRTNPAGARFRRSRRAARGDRDRHSLPGPARRWRGQLCWSTALPRRSAARRSSSPAPRRTGDRRRQPEQPRLPALTRRRTDHVW